MQTSLDRTTWKEDEKAQAARRLLRADSRPDEKRSLFPLSGILKETKAFPLPPGTFFRYIRTLDIPSSLPIEALVWTAQGDAKILKFFGCEVSLTPPNDDKD